MNIKNNLITVIVGGGVLKNTAYQDGTVINMPKTTGVRHLVELQKIAESLGIEDLCNNELDMMKLIARRGHSVILNYGIQDNKQTGIVILPKQLTSEQIKSFEKLKQELMEEYKSITSCAIPNKPLMYKGDLKLMEYEDKINGINLSDVDSLFNEINIHKQNLQQLEESDEPTNHK